MGCFSVKRAFRLAILLRTSWPDYARVAPDGPPVAERQLSWQGGVAPPHRGEGGLSPFPRMLEGYEAPYEDGAIRRRTA